MSNKTRNAEKVKTRSALSKHLLAKVSVAIILVCILSFIFLLLSGSRTNPSSQNNCESPSSKSEIFHCNVTKLEYAVEPDQWELGLSGQDSMPAEQGMLFVYGEPSRQCIWMKDMKFSLDIVWLNENKQITKLLKDVSPDTYPTSFCAEDTRYVLEVNSGVMDKLGIGVGDSIQL